MPRWSGASKRSWSTNRRVEATIAILRGLQEKYEVHHGVDITDPAIVAAAELSHRYITDRFLPDKAIDLIDEAASKIKIEIDSKPEVMDKLDRRLIQLKIEREAVKEGKGRSVERRMALDRKEIEKLQREYADLEEIWKSEKVSVQGSRAHQGRNRKVRAANGKKLKRAAIGKGRRNAVRQAAAAGSAIEGSRAAKPKAGKRACCAPKSARKKSPKW